MGRCATQGTTRENLATIILTLSSGRIRSGAVLQ